jgi:hypothetical protein
MAAWVMDVELGLGRWWGSGVMLAGWLALMTGFRWWLAREWRTREFVARQLNGLA